MDHQTVCIEFDNGAQGVFAVNAVSGMPGRDITIHGTDGCISGDSEADGSGIRTTGRELMTG